LGILHEDPSTFNCIVDSNAKQQYEGNPFVRFHGNTQGIYIFDSDRWGNNKRKMRFHGNKDYTKAPQFYVRTVSMLLKFTVEGPKGFLLVI
jgi:hypothetical protein